MTEGNKSITGAETRLTEACAGWQHSEVLLKSSPVGLKENPFYLSLVSPRWNATAYTASKQLRINQESSRKCVNHLSLALKTRMSVWEQ